MNDNWLKKVNMTIEERSNLEMWCKNIGYERYERIYKVITQCINNKEVDYVVLKVIAKYDFCLSDFLHSMIKFIELRLRAFLINNYGKLSINRSEFLYQISNALSQGKRYLECNTYYDKKLPERTTLSEYLMASSMETLIRIIFLLPDDYLYQFDENIDRLKENLTLIKNIRNQIAHGQVLVGNKKINLKQIIMIMLKYMPTKESKIKRIEAMNELSKRLFKEECELPQLLLEKVQVVFSEKDMKEIGL